MKFTEETLKKIDNFIIDNVEDHPNDLTAFLCSGCKISKPTAEKRIKFLIAKEIITKTSSGRYPNYTLKKWVYTKKYNLADHLDEDILFKKDFKPLLSDFSQNVGNGLYYGFCEMVNNVIDHSSATEMTITLSVDARKAEFRISDNGVGIFNKIQKDLGLELPSHSILELAKGKFTSDKTRHSGEGVFFTSRITDCFLILSGNLAFWGNREKDYRFENNENTSGTVVFFYLLRNTKINIEDVFNEFSDPDSMPSFYKTCIPLNLMEIEGENLVSRSQARRLINRFDKFLEVVLNFEGVSFIGQAFADEIFRVFHNMHPDIKLVPINCCDGVKKMIAHTGAEFSHNQIT